MDDRYTFGPLIRLRMRADGSLRLETWRDRWISALSDAFWPKPLYTVTAIDRERGIITLA